VREPDEPRVLVSRDALLHEVADLVGGSFRAFLERYGRANLLAEVLVRNPDDRGFPNGGMLVEDLLDLARVDVVAAADHKLLLSVDDEVVAVLVDGSDVAGVEPAVAHDLVG